MKKYEGKLYGESQGQHMIYTEARTLDEALNLLLEKKRHKPQYKKARKARRELVAPKPKISLPTITLREPKWGKP